MLVIRRKASNGLYYANVIVQKNPEYEIAPDDCLESQNTWKLSALIDFGSARSLINCNSAFMLGFDMKRVWEVAVGADNEYCGYKTAAPIATADGRQSHSVISSSPRSIAFDGYDKDKGKKVCFNSLFKSRFSVMAPPVPYDEKRDNYEQRSKECDRYIENMVIKKQQGDMPAPYALVGGELLAQFTALVNACDQEGVCLLIPRSEYLDTIAPSIRRHLPSGV